MKSIPENTGYIATLDILTANCREIETGEIKFGTEEKIRYLAKTLREAIEIFHLALTATNPKVDGAVAIEKRLESVK